MCGARMPEERAKNPGSSSWPTAMTGTPRVSRYSRVAGTSRIAFGPAQTTATGVRPSSSRSDEMSNVGAAATRARRARRGGRRRCRRSRRPRMPAACAAIIVAETVVAAQPPSASAIASDGRAALRTDPGGRRREGLEAAGVEADEQPAVVDGDGRRDGARLADGGLGGRARPRGSAGTAGRG